MGPLAVLRITIRNVGDQVNRQNLSYIADAPLRKTLGNLTNAEIAAVKHYLENTHKCRHNQLLRYFDSSSS